MLLTGSTLSMSIGVAARLKSKKSRRNIGKLLVLGVVARPRGKLQRRYGLGIPCVAYAVLAVMELSKVRQKVCFRLLGKALVVHGNGIPGNRLKPNAPDG